MQIPIPGKKLQKQTNFTEQALPEFPELLFGKADDGKTYFDATRYLQAKKSKLTVESFFTVYDATIKSLVASYGIDANSVCIVDLNGHYLIDNSLCYIFIASIDPNFWAYMMDRINDLFAHGFCVSDSYLFGMTKQRFPKEVIQSMTDDASV